MIRPRVAQLLMHLVRVLIGSALGLGLQPAMGQGRQPALPPSRPTLYDPDRTTCEPERIRQAFQQQLQPFADQSDAVINQLRQVQLDMTRSSLRRCVSRELLTRQQADQLFRELATSPIRP
jgi:hypothetical protein